MSFGELQSIPHLLCGIMRSNPPAGSVDSYTTYVIMCALYYISICIYQETKLANTVHCHSKVNFQDVWSTLWEYSKELHQLCSHIDYWEHYCGWCQSHTRWIVHIKASFEDAYKHTANYILKNTFIAFNDALPVSLTVHSQLISKDTLKQIFEHVPKYTLLMQASPNLTWLYAPMNAFRYSI
jgi:hypothetical protein